MPDRYSLGEHANIQKKASIARRGYVGADSKYSQTLAHWPQKERLNTRILRPMYSSCLQCPGLNPTFVPHAVDHGDNAGIQHAGSTAAWYDVFWYSTSKDMCGAGVASCCAWGMLNTMFWVGASTPSKCATSTVSSSRRWRLCCTAANSAGKVPLGVGCKNNLAASTPGCIWHSHSLVTSHSAAKLTGQLRPSSATH